MNKLPILLFAFLLMVSLYGHRAYAQTPVTLRPTSEVRAEVIKLADVFDGVPQDQNVDLALSPAPGKSVTYDARVLTRLSEQYHLEWKAKSLADKAVLTRSATQITPDMIRDAVATKVRQDDPKLPPSIEIAFDSRFVGLTLPAENKPDFTVTSFDYDPSSKRFRAEIQATPQGSAPLRQLVSGRLLVKADVPVLTHRLTAGTTLSERDLTWQKMPQEKLPTDAVTDMAAIVGQELRRDQDEGEIFRARDLIAPRLVTRGSLVTMKITTPLMQITTQGKALQDGARGDVIRVTNMQSNRVVEGTVEAGGVVRIGSANPKVAELH